MKTSLILSTVLCALTLTPAAFANGAQEQTAASPVTAAAAPSGSVTVFTVQQVPPAASVTRAVLQQLDVDVRAELLSGLRGGATLVIEAVQVVVPAVAATAGKSLDLSAR